MNDTFAKLNSNYFNGITEKQFGFNKKKFFTKRDTRGLQTRIELNLAAIPVCAEPDKYQNHHHIDYKVKQKRFYMKSPDVPIHDNTVQHLEKEYIYMSN